MPESVSNNEQQHEEEKFDPQDTLSQMTPEQVREKEQIYEKEIDKILQRNKISADDLTDLIESLKLVIEDIANGEYSRPIEEEEESIQDSNEEEEEEKQDEDTEQSENAENHQSGHEEGQ
jgi:hypothetical protein